MQLFKNKFVMCICSPPQGNSASHHLQCYQLSFFMQIPLQYRLGEFVTALHYMYLISFTHQSLICYVTQEDCHSGTTAKEFHFDTAQEFCKFLSCNQPIHVSSRIHSPTYAEEWGVYCTYFNKKYTRLVSLKLK